MSKYSDYLIDRYDNEKSKAECAEAIDAPSKSIKFDTNDLTPPDIYFRSKNEAFFGGIEDIHDAESISLITYQIGGCFPPEIVRLIHSSSVDAKIRIAFCPKEGDINNCNKTYWYNTPEKSYAIQALLSLISNSINHRTFEILVLNDNHIKLLQVDDTWICGSMNISSTAAGLENSFNDKGKVTHSNKKSIPQHFRNNELILRFHNNGQEMSDQIWESLCSTTSCNNVVKYDHPNGLEEFKSSLKELIGRGEREYLTAELLVNYNAEKLELIMGKLDDIYQLIDLFIEGELSDESVFRPDQDEIKEEFIELCNIQCSWFTEIVDLGICWDKGIECFNEQIETFDANQLASESLEENIDASHDSDLRDEMLDNIIGSFEDMAIELEEKSYQEALPIFIESLKEIIYEELYNIE